MTPPPVQTTPTSAGPAPPRFLQGGAARGVEEAEVGAELAGPQDAAPPDFPPPSVPQIAPPMLLHPSLSLYPYVPQIPIAIAPSNPYCSLSSPSKPPPQISPHSEPPNISDPPHPLWFPLGSFVGGRPCAGGGDAGGRLGSQLTSCPPIFSPHIQVLERFPPCGIPVQVRGGGGE